VGVDCKFLNFGGSNCKITDTSWVKSEFSPIYFEVVIDIIKLLLVYILEIVYMIMDR
jgi:hypothetical protein